MAQFGDYTLTGKLGTGDMGTVYQATHPDSPEPIAIKILDKVDTRNSDQRGAALEVMEFAATIEHDQLHQMLRVLEVGEGEAGKLAIAMPLAAMRSLGDNLAKGRKIPPKMSFKVIAQVASALQPLHDMEVAHGSIKPNNVLLDKEGNATLTDLAMAHLRELGYVPAKPTDQHLLFMQPEREYHAAPAIDGDVFSLGVLSYLLLAGEMPWQETDPHARGVVSGDNLPPALAAVLRKELNPQPRLRYQDIASFMTALKSASRGQVDPETEQVFGVKPPEDPFTLE